jgi:hypothetical protein
MSQLHPVFEGILRDFMVAQADDFRRRYESKELQWDADMERRRDADEALLAARQVQEEEDAKAEFRLQSARDDYARDLRAEREACGRDILDCTFEDGCLSCPDAEDDDE